MIELEFVIRSRFPDHPQVGTLTMRERVSSDATQQDVMRLIELRCDDLKTAMVSVVQGSMPKRHAE